MIVGTVEVVKEYYPDPTDASGRFGMVDVRAVESAVRPVTLAEIKAAPDFAELPLVPPVPASPSRRCRPPLWAKLCAMAGVAA